MKMKRQARTRLTKTLSMLWLLLVGSVLLLLLKPQPMPISNPVRVHLPRNHPELVLA
ncbi:hypothetical protein D3C87_1274180 [compost metagenome]